MPIVSIAGNPTIVEFSISTHHITVICHKQGDKLETNNRIGTDSSHSENERETQQSGDLLFVCENGKATHNGQYSLLSLTGTGIVLMRESEELTIQLLI